MGVAGVEPLADGALAGPAMAGHGLIHEDNEGCGGVVIGSEGATGQQGNAHGAEVVAIAVAKAANFSFQLSMGSGDGVGGESGRVGSRQRVGNTGGDNGRLGGKAFEESAIEGGGSRIGGVWFKGSWKEATSRWSGRKPGSTASMF